MINCGLASELTFKSRLFEGHRKTEEVTKDVKGAGEDEAVKGVRHSKGVFYLEGEEILRPNPN